MNYTQPIVPENIPTFSDFKKRPAFFGFKPKMASETSGNKKTTWIVCESPDLLFLPLVLPLSGCVFGSEFRCLWSAWVPSSASGRPTSNCRWEPTSPEHPELHELEKHTGKEGLCPNGWVNCTLKFQIWGIHPWTSKSCWTVTRLGFECQAEGFSTILVDGLEHF